MNRRDFLVTTAAAVVGAGTDLAGARGQGATQPSPPGEVAGARTSAPSDRVRVAVIGTGRQGVNDMRAHMALPDVEVVAICDVYEPNLAIAAEAAPNAVREPDFRRILDRQDVDAVIIGTPDHWHALQTVMACQAGKDVYVEKPTSVAITEGRRMVEAARKYSRIVQVGTQQRSQPHFADVVGFVRSGKLGTITMVRAWNVGNQAPEGIGSPPDGNPPPGLDWDLWLGPAPKVPFNPNRFGVYPEAWSYFRYFWDYAGGLMTDWGVHLIDIVHWAMDVDAPSAVTAIGGKLALQDNRDTPDTLVATYQYPGFVMCYETRSANGRPINEHGYGIEFYGTEGTLFVDRGGFNVVPERRRVSGQEFMDRTDPVSGTAPPPTTSHARNFIDCVKSRALPICDIEIGHRSSSAAILGNLAYRSGASLRWNGKEEEIADNDAAAKLLERRYRKPWKLKT